ncbi:hypothetical protein [Chryseobacterium foetidum]|uniref:hypothetical protein n=1 Tax=Chryseobacterium foetidum TaxID=2951057 RepID=UPI0021C5C09E|nr:hypothetical protein [Chryseobacterium foetidum]
MILGITGHQKLENFDENWIIKEIRNFVLKNSVDKGISCLAIGADQLFCEELVNNKIDYDVIIPCENYLSTFKKKEDILKFTSLLGLSKNVLTLNFEKPSEEAFYAAGQKILEYSTTIIAVWDGKPAKGLGGTGDIVKAALSFDKKVYHINPVEKNSKYLNCND